MGVGLSVHIGVNSVDPEHYDAWDGALQACENDASAMLDLATDCGYEASCLLTGEAKREAVIGAIEAAAERLRAGDTFLLTYAGHGGQVPDTSGDEPDSWDETWCLYDGQILDDELLALWHRFAPGARIIVVSDSCHSGSATRAPSATAASPLPPLITDELGFRAGGQRCMPADRALRTFQRNVTFYRDVADSVDRSDDPPTPVRLLSGCQDNQFSLDGEKNGLFTTALLLVWDGGAFEGHYRAFHQQIQLLMPATQSPNHFLIGPSDPIFDAQRPFTR